ncbi:hypothetical protein TNCV_3174101 [Trichonephila clavipes]|nr:hypothetical protein TNCV_3174101 [Trichonephila clavipes]
MGNRKSTLNSTSTTSPCKSHCAKRVYGIIYHTAILFGGDGCFWPCYGYSHWSEPWVSFVPDHVILDLQHHGCVD